MQIHCWKNTHILNFRDIGDMKLKIINRYDITVFIEVGQLSAMKKDFLYKTVKYSICTGFLEVMGNGTFKRCTAWMGVLSNWGNQKKSESYRVILIFNRFLGQVKPEELTSYLLKSINSFLFIIMPIRRCFLCFWKKKCLCCFIAVQEKIEQGWLLI